MNSKEYHDRYYQVTKHGASIYFKIYNATGGRRGAIKPPELVRNNTHCPVCSAVPGQPCIGVIGQERLVLHRARFLNYEQPTCTKCGQTIRSRGDGK